MVSILANIFRLGGMQLVIAFTAIARNKVLSFRLGPDGYGEFIQLVMITTAASVVAAFGLGMSLNRNVAATSDRQRRQRLLANGNAVNIGLSLSIILIIGGVLAVHPDALYWIGVSPNRDLLLSMFILLTAIPLDAAVHHRVGFLVGSQDIKGMSSGRSTALVIGTLISVPLIWYLGLVGAALQLVALSVLIVVMLDRRCRALGYSPWAIAFDRTVFLEMARLGMAAIIAGVAAQLSDVTVRANLLRIRGAAEGGIYQAALSITHQVRAIVLGSVGSYMIAILSQNTDRRVATDTANRLLTVVLPIAMGAFSVLGLLAGPLIVILYSAEFLPAQQILPVFLLTFFIEVMTWVVGAPLLAFNRIGVWLGLELSLSAMRLAFALPFIADHGMAAVALAYGSAAVIHLMLNLAYYIRGLRLSIGWRQVTLFAIGLLTTTTYGILGSLNVFDLQTVLVGLITLMLITVGVLHISFGLGNIVTSTRNWFGGKGLSRG